MSIYERLRDQPHLPQSETDPTPVPWKTIAALPVEAGYVYSHILLAKVGGALGYSPTEGPGYTRFRKADADLIVRAVNAHDIYRRAVDMHLDPLSDREMAHAALRIAQSVGNGADFDEIVHRAVGKAVLIVSSVFGADGNEGSVEHPDEVATIAGALNRAREFGVMEASSRDAAPVIESILQIARNLMGDVDMGRTVAGTTMRQEVPVLLAIVRLIGTP